MKRSLASAVFSLILIAPSLRAAEYKIDPVHSGVTFSVRHMMVSKVQGKFDQFEGSFSYDPKDPDASKAEATIQTESIDTGNPKRDGHLKSKDFFDAQEHPAITFKSTRMKMSGDKGILYGMLTMRGVTKTVALNVEFGGIAKDPMGAIRAGFEATTRVNRQDYGIAWNKAMEGGGVVVGDQVDIALHIEGVQEPAAGKKMEKAVRQEQKPARKK